MPVTSTRSPAANTSALMTWPTSNTDTSSTRSSGEALHRVEPPAFLRWPSSRLGEPARLASAERELHRGVAVALGRLQLDDAAGPGLDHGHGDDPVLGVPDLGHAELAPEDPLDCGHLWSLSRLPALRRASRERSAGRAGGALSVVPRGSLRAGPARTSTRRRAVRRLHGRRPLVRRTPAGRAVDISRRRSLERLAERRDPPVARFWSGLLDLDLDVDPGGEVEALQRLDRLARGLDDVERRLWIRISKCSRESLSTWGERTTQ